MYHCEYVYVCLDMCVNCVSLCRHAFVTLSLTTPFRYRISMFLSNSLWRVCTRSAFPSTTECHPASSSFPECQGAFCIADHRANLGGGLGLYSGINEDL